MYIHLNARLALLDGHVGQSDHAFGPSQANFKSRLKSRLVEARERFSRRGRLEVRRRHGDPFPTVVGVRAPVEPRQILAQLGDKLDAESVV